MSLKNEALLIESNILLEKTKNKELEFLKLKIIQGQMNPHFIFNAINSIQNLILHESVYDSYEYLAKFSKLIRQSLSFSTKEVIDFEEEFSLLEGYLEIEQLRFKTDFEFTISSNGIENIKIPPMLIQPFVENAIKHGLLHKTGQKKITISFEKKEVLICTIIDNGIGRKTSEEIKKRQKNSYKSFSVNSIFKQMEILNDYYNQDFLFVYEDLYVNEITTGTKVVINIPFKDI